MKLLDQFKDLILTGDQQKAVASLADFFESDNKFFLLKGYAGSGKTTLLKGIADYLHAIGTPCQLMAPTGRAAKIIRDKTGKVATTIHKGIYSFSDLDEIKVKDEEGNESFLFSFKLRNNTDAFRTFFLIDEASMISNILSEGEFFRFGTGYLLNDLIRFADIDNPSSRAKIIFIGDPAQLPPIGMNFSPALDEQYLSEQFAKIPVSVELTQVVRQNSDNTILRAATRMRQSLQSGFFNDFNLRPDQKYIFQPVFNSFLDAYKVCEAPKIIITYKNKTALDLNSMVRTDKYGADINIQQSDTIIVGANNYKLEILNGELGVVANVKPETISRTIIFKKKKNETAHIELVWRYVELVFPDSETNSKVVSGFILENYLYGNNYLTSDEQRALYVDFKNRHPDLRPKTEEFKMAIASDPFFNCILIKYGYAITCHKAQGGEWNNVFVLWDYGVKEDFNFYSESQSSAARKNAGFYRWAYTAVTRASMALHVINPPCFNSFSAMTFIEPSVAMAIEALNGKSTSPEEICIDENVLGLLKQYKLEESPVSIQNHFIKLHFLAAKHALSITSYNKKGIEIWCTFSQANEFATIKFWVNGKNEFSATKQIVPKATNSNSLAEIVLKICNSLDQVTVIPQSTETNVIEFGFNLNMAADKPFLGILFDNLKTWLNPHNIRITDIEHLEWRERYTLQRAEEVAVIDFIYDKNGFFGKVTVNEKKTNGSALINDLKIVLNCIKLS